MKRIDAMFRRLRGEKRCGLIAYVTCGDPDVETTVEVIRELERAGADAIELGVPFSDPIADGPVIQAASFRALSGGTTIEDVFAIARRVRETSQIPLIAFSYLNPVCSVGPARFAAECASSGIDAALLTDLPPEASREIGGELGKKKLGLIFLLAPTSSPDRIRLVDRHARGFVYYVSTTGVTGARRDLDPALIARLDEVRASVRHPLAVGFGISEAAHYEAIAPHADAVVVGSAIVRAIAEGDGVTAPGRAGELVRRILGRTES